MHCWQKQKLNCRNRIPLQIKNQVLGRARTKDISSICEFKRKKKLSMNVNERTVFIMLIKFSLFLERCLDLPTSHIFFYFLFLLATTSILLLNQTDMHGSCQISQGKIGGGVFHFNLSHRMGTQFGVSWGLMISYNSVERGQGQFL